MERKREKARVERELKDAVANLQKARIEQRNAEAVVTAMEEVKAHSLDMLGKGRKKEAINNIKGLQTHMSRIMEAKKRKIEAAQVFLLPSEKAKLAKAKL